MATLPMTDNEHSALGTKVANLQHRWSQALRRSIKGDKDKDKGRDRDSDGNRQNAAPNIQKLAVAIMPPKKVGKVLELTQLPILGTAAAILGALPSNTIVVGHSRNVCLSSPNPS